jgi:trk system potassium uptake protein TrkH
MFIGGSPVGTAGGVKTVTLAVLAAAALSSIRGRNKTVLFGRTVSRATVGRAIGVVGMSFGIMLLSTLLLSFVTSYASAMDILYETVSATATVGLSRDLTPALSSAGKLIVTSTMYLGRVGPISLAIAFGLRRESKNLIVNPTEEVSVG